MKHLSRYQTVKTVFPKKWGRGELHPDPANCTQFPLATPKGKAGGAGGHQAEEMSRKTKMTSHGAHGLELHIIQISSPTGELTEEFRPTS